MSDEGSKDKDAPSPELKEVLRISPPQDADPSRANAEEKTFDSLHDYEKESRKKDHQRGETLKVILHKLVIFGLIIAGIILFFGIVTWAWHLLTPDNWHWLSIEQIYDIQKIMSSALLALVISDYSKKYLK